MKNINRNHIAALAASAILLGFASGAMATTDTINMTDNTSNYSDSVGGGEFGASILSTTVAPQSLPNLPNGATTGGTINLGAYSSLTTGIANTGVNGNSTTGQGGNGTSILNSGLKTFQTFCLESNVSFSPGTTYNFTVSQFAAKNGGFITNGVAYLYSQFAAGTLNGYNYVEGSGRTSTALALQELIWLLQGQTMPNGNAISLSQIEGLTGGNKLLSDLETQGYTSGTNYNYTLNSSAQLASDGNYDVAAMILYSGSASAPVYAQDQLVMISPTSNGSPVPDGGATIMLLGMALGGVSFLRRKMA